MNRIANASLELLATALWLRSQRVAAEIIQQLLILLFRHLRTAGLAN